MNLKRIFVILNLVLSLGSFKSFAGIDAKTQDLLIQKLTSVYLNLAVKDPARTGVALRLGDLHAERARHSFMEDINQGCTNCQAGKQDRLQALKYYNEVLPTVPASSRGKVVLQMGHLYELQGDLAKAEKAYRELISQSASPADLAEAHLSLAEMKFKAHQYESARAEFQEVLKIPGAASRGLAAYRLAWSSFNLGETKKAVEQLQLLLKTKEWQSRSGTSENQADHQFLEEVSQDLSTFMAKNGVATTDIQSLYDLSPDSAKLPNVTRLARELDRLGDRKASVFAWNFVGERQKEPAMRLEAEIHLAQLRLDLGELANARENFERSMNLWAQLNGCGQADCQDSQKLVRQFVLNFNRLEKSKPSAELQAVYASYLAQFPQDQDMAIWGAQVAHDRKDDVTALAWNNQAAQLILKEAPTTELNQKLEKTLLASLEFAEQTKDVKALEQAQAQYLASSRLKSKSLDVEYQKIYAIYNAGDYVTAGNAFHQLALGTAKGDEKIKVQAADLALDSLGQLKDDEKIAVWSSEFSKRFPLSKASFANVKEKALLSQSATLAKTNPNQAYAVLTQFNPADASGEDKKVYLKNKIILAEKLGKYTEARVATEDFLKEKLTPQEREFALERKLWLSELNLDFKSALETAQKMNFSQMTLDQKALKLAHYSELAEKDPQIFYREYLKTSQDDEKKQAIAGELIRRSAQPMKEIEAQKKIFSKNPEMLARLYFEINQKTPTPAAVQALRGPALAFTEAGKVTQREIYLKELQALQQKFAQSQIDSSTQKKLGQTLKARVKILEDLDKTTNQTIAAQDWTSQLVAIDMVAKENQRFYQEVLGLPMPQGLSGEQEQEYLQLLSQQASPHQKKAEEAQVKVKEFWAQTATLEKYSEADDIYKKELKSELLILQQIAPAENKARVDAMLLKVQPTALAVKTTPSLRELEAAKDDLRKFPFKAQALSKVLELEKQNGNVAMVQYLQSRLDSVQSNSNGTGGVQ